MPDSRLLFVIASLLACDSTESSNQPRTPGDSNGPVACDDAMTVIGTLDAEGTTVTFDTSGLDASRDLGVSCPAADGAPQALVAFHVPGAGPMVVGFSTVHAGTAFDTMIQVRSDGCETTPPAFPLSCFDNADPSGGEYRTEGAFSTTGGSLVYLVVTGSEACDARGCEGAVELSFVVEPTTPPTVSNASIFIGYGDFDSHFKHYVVFETEGSAPEGLGGLGITLLDDLGEAVDANGDGRAVAAEDTVYSLVGALDVSMTGSDFVAGLDTTPDQIFPNAVLRSHPTQARFVAFDERLTFSDAITVPFERVGFYQTPCDSGRCMNELECISDTCVPVSATVQDCSAATSLTLPATVSGTLPGSTPGSFWGLCPSEDFDVSLATRRAGEDLYAVDVPDGAWDLIAATNVDGTAANANTIVYVRRECEDPASEVACHTYDTLIDRRARVELLDAEPGGYIIVVEQHALVTYDADFDYGLHVWLRPVLASGAACDPSGADNRCAAGPCTSEGLCP